jgi:rod shape-determining protein MreD
MQLKDIIRAAAGILAAFVIYSLMDMASFYLTVLIHVFSIIVVYFAVVRGEIFGAVTGAACGLIQDSFTLGVFGIYGISKTIMGYLAGYTAKRVMIASRFRLFLFMWILFTLELGFWILMYSLIFAQPLNIYGGMIFIGPLVSAIVGSQFFPLFRKMYPHNGEPQV